jgi:hypothetical protein
MLAFMGVPGEKKEEVEEPAPAVEVTAASEENSQQNL